MHPQQEWGPSFPSSRGHFLDSIHVLLIPKALPGGAKLQHQQQGIARHQACSRRMDALAGGGPPPVCSPNRSSEPQVSRQNPRQDRWSLFFTRFQFTITHCLGAKNVKADALSQLHFTEEFPDLTTITNHSFMPDCQPHAVVPGQRYRDIQCLQSCSARVSTSGTGSSHGPSTLRIPCDSLLPTSLHSSAYSASSLHSSLDWETHQKFQQYITGSRTQITNTSKEQSDDTNSTLLPEELLHPSTHLASKCGSSAGTSDSPARS